MGNPPAQPRGVGRWGVGARPSPGLVAARHPEIMRAWRARSHPVPRRRGPTRRLGSRDAPPRRSPTKFGGRAGPGALARGRPPPAAPCDLARGVRPPPGAPGPPARAPDRLAPEAEERPLGCGPDLSRRMAGSPRPQSVCVALLAVFSPMCGFFSWSCFIGIPVIKTWCSLGALI